jgi:hypothetical protein
MRRVPPSSWCQDNFRCSILHAHSNIWGLIIMFSFSLLICATPNFFWIFYKHTGVHFKQSRST